MMLWIKKKRKIVTQRAQSCQVKVMKAQLKVQFGTREAQPATVKSQAPRVRTIIYESNYLPNSFFLLKTDKTTDSPARSNLLGVLLEYLDIQESNKPWLWLILTAAALWKPRGAISVAPPLDCGSHSQR